TIENCIFQNSSPITGGVYIVSSKYVEIRNCYFIDNNIGIWVQSSSDLIISNNQVTGSDAQGIMIQYSTELMVDGNEIFSNHDAGIALNDSNSVIVKQNQIYNNNNSGMILTWGSYNCTVEGNYIYKNSMNGIYIDSGQNRIAYNTIDGNHNDGIHVSYTMYSSFIGNTIKNNSNGIVLNQSQGSTIMQNTLENNQNYGIVVALSTQNLIYINSFISNGAKQAYLLNFNNQTFINRWDNGYVGNYWSDYSSLYHNADNDGRLWDTPYRIPGEYVPSFQYEKYYSDNYPLVSPYEPPKENMKVVIASAVILPLAPFGFILVLTIFQRRRIF
ncbi:MAG: right-handed parallel beta-helix repeat-containing protein, partial [Promethearchaeota archaeon]